MDFARTPAASLPPTPPADRPLGRPGLRGRIAGLVALGAIPALALSTRSNRTSGGGGGSATDSSGSFSYTFNLGAQSLGVELGLSAVAVLLIVAATMLWRARSSRLVAVAGVIAVGSAAAAVLILRAAPAHGTPSLATLNSIAIGTPRASVIRALGSPLVQADTTATGGRPAPVCLIYAIGHPRPIQNGPGSVAVPDAERNFIPPDAQNAALCFARGLLAAKLPA